MAQIVGVPPVRYARAMLGGAMNCRRLGIVGATLLGTAFSVLAMADGQPGPYARIEIMRAIDGHGIEWEEGYIRHLEWHRQAKDTFAWYSYSIWASGEHQRWIMYATFGHTGAELSNPVSPAEDERDSVINLLPHSQFLGNWVYEFLPALSHGNGVPTPTPRADWTTVEVNLGADKAFETVVVVTHERRRVRLARLPQHD